MHGRLRPALRLPASRTTGVRHRGARNSLERSLSVGGGGGGGGVVPQLQERAALHASGTLPAVAPPSTPSLKAMT